MAVYPNGIPTFVVHRNLLDDVDAVHINAIQTEVTAVAGLLGVNPQIYADVNTPNIQIPAGGTATGVLQDSDTIANAAAATASQRNHGTLGRRLDFIEQGRQNHCFRLGATTFPFPATASGGTRPKGIKFPNPSPNTDPFSMFNGVGVTLRKSGFWYIGGTVTVNRLGTTAPQNTGVFQAAIDRDSDWMDGMDRRIFQDGGQQSFALNPSIGGFFNRGTKVSLRISQTTPIAHAVTSARFFGFLIREDL